MVKVIISHDVDHLFARDHWFHDLIYPKMWIRTTIQLIRREITIKEWWLRNISCFRHERHKIDELMDFDRKYSVPSIFFFGMNQGLGMSYKPEDAKSVIDYVRNNGFFVGVHGIEYRDYKGMLKEFNTFTQITGHKPDGIRMHYVRFDENTFDTLSKVGYSFDTTEFDKEKKGTRKKPYKVGSMWEFPLTIMDGYLPQNFDKAKEKTLEILEECKVKKLDYITVLFHDYQFCDDYKDIRDWYIWLIKYFSESSEYEFITYSDAIEQMELQSATIS